MALKKDRSGERFNKVRKERLRHSYDVLFSYKVLDAGYINIDMPPLIQFYSDSIRYSLRGRDDFVLRRIMLRLKLTNLAFLMDC